MHKPILFLVLLLTSQICAQRVVVLGFDGLGGRAFNNTSTPNINELIKQGAHSLKAEAVLPTVSSPNWASMINGASPRQHHIRSNSWEMKKIKNKSYCGQANGELFPTIFKVVREQRPNTRIECIHHWQGFARLTNQSSLDTIFHTADEYSTLQTTCERIRSAKPDFLFVHFDHVDHAGHEYGYFTELYYKAVHTADSMVGVIVQTLKDESLYDETYIFITADHGGNKKGHGGRTRQEIEIPWILKGPTVKAGHIVKTIVKQFDTAPTIARIYKLQVPDCWIGKPVKEVFVNE